MDRIVGRARVKLKDSSVQLAQLVQLANIRERVARLARLARRQEAN